ncbi:hypothetical protein E2C01_023461 [Portunus trituberculatus]|uniref:Uncharacterized protein n=1 Tax=Portunus trituberculatus TaxID=210409 RepID=A0A5B7E819_PORTR|nr:hypothetical protein [Portunus trituberculatus]
MSQPLPRLTRLGLSQALSTLIIIPAPPHSASSYAGNTDASSRRDGTFGNTEHRTWRKTRPLHHRLQEEEEEEEEEAIADIKKKGQQNRKRKRKRKRKWRRRRRKQVIK